MMTSELQWIQERAKELGFPVTGITAVEPMDPAPLHEWLDAGYGAEMDYLQRHLPLRANLDSVVPDAKSVISAAMPYPGPSDSESPIGHVARYARGANYHDVVRERLETLWEELHSRYPEAEGRVFVDSGPLPERELARRAGIGWTGKHSCLMNPVLGSRFVLGEIVTTLEIEPTTPLSGSCGNCRACMTACPTGAIAAPGVVDARRCLSYLTIEHKGAVPREIRPLMGTRLFGCDTCQDACPHNRRIGELDTPFLPSADLVVPDPCAILHLSPEAFNARFRSTPIQRTKRRGLLRNACVALGNLGDQASLPVLREALHEPEPLVRGHAAWALGQLGDADTLKEALETEQDAYVRDEIEAAMGSI